jgi:hypothetical protein
MSILDTDFDNKKDKSNNIETNNFPIPITENKEIQLINTKTKRSNIFSTEQIKNSKGKYK